MNSSEQIGRVERMEAAFDRSLRAIAALDRALKRYERAQADMDAVIAYYDSGEWKQDYLDDCDGLLPDGLKRGVLSEDGVYDMIADRVSVTDEMKRIAAGKKSVK